MDKISVGLRNEVIKRMTQQANRAQTVLNLYVPRVRDAGLPNLADDLAQHVGIAIQTNANIVKQLVEDAEVIADPVPDPEPPPPPPPPPPDPEPEPDPEPPPPPPVTSSRPFTGSNSPFGQPIPANPEIDPNSAAMVSYLVERENLRAFNMAVSAWTVPLFYADANTPRYDVPLTKAAGWGWPSPMKGVPIPADAKPDPQGDSHLAIIDTSTGCLYEFWQARKTSTGWAASSGNAIPISSNGIYPDGRSVTASGFSILAGRIWPEELGSDLVIGYDNDTGSGTDANITPLTQHDFAVTPDGSDITAQIATGGFFRAS
jgi:hypothetical protein